MQAMLHSAFSVAFGTIFASIVAEAASPGPFLAILLVVIGAMIPSLTAIYLASKQTQREAGAQAIIDRAEREALALLDKAAEKAVKIVAEARPRQEGEHGQGK